MATNDVNLQVINSMTQDKMNSLKDADGKIPSLANQIIMTDEEDTSLSQFRIEPIYDMYSNDDNINKNRKTGIFSGTWNVFTIDAKYSGIRVYACLANKHTVFDCDLDLIKNGSVSEVTATGIAKNQNTSGNNAYILYGCNITISSDLSFTVREIFAYNGVADAYSSYTSSDTTYFVYKVEGILKEPAMIYTGAELNSGEGIVINNGTLSSNVTRKTLFQGTVSSASEFSLNDTLANYKFILLTAFDNFNNYVTTMIDVSTLRVHSTRTAPIGISSSSSAVDRYAEVYYVNETKLGILTPKNMSLRFVEGIK